MVLDERKPWMPASAGKTSGRNLGGGGGFGDANFA
jgi:hypothetical protein